MPHLGDPLPVALAAYYEAIDAGRMDEVAACFTDEAVVAIPDPAATLETAPRLVLRGRAAIAEWLAVRGVSAGKHRVDLGAVEGDRGLVEGTVVVADGSEVAGFAGSVTVAPDGRLARYLVFAGRPAPRPSAADLAPVDAPGDATAVFHAYLTALQEGRVDEALAHFEDDAVYSHSPFVHAAGAARLEFRGRDAIAAGFGARGVAPFRHSVVAAGQRGAHLVLEGRTHHASTGADRGSFVSILSVGATGRIARYVSYYTEPTIP